MRAIHRLAACLPPRAAAVAMAAALALAACTDDGDRAEDDTAAAGHVAAALDSGSELSRLFAPLQASSDLGGLGPDAARARKVQAAVLAFIALAASPLCVTVMTDSLTYLDVTFKGCRVGLIFTLDGSLRAGVAIEATGGVPSALVATVTMRDLTLAGPQHTQRLAGEVELRQRISPQGAPAELTGDLRFSVDREPELALSFGTQWTVVNDCVTLTGGAQLSGEALGALGPIALSGDRVQSCRDQCPTAGSVELAYGHGSLLEWTYTGASTVSVIGPRGKRVEVPLACGGNAR
jgi:hypothetical protein